MSTRRMARVPRRGPRRRLDWAQFNAGEVVGTAAHGVNVDLLGQYRNAGGTTSDVTVMRTHLRLWPTTAVVAADVLQLGIGVMSLQSVSASFSTGLTPGFPNVVDAPYDDWMLVDQRVASPTYGDHSANNQMAYDLRSKRKITGLDETLVLNICNTGASATMTIAVFARVLLALP